jgi:cytidyltransferase-like protein
MFGAASGSRLREHAVCPGTFDPVTPGHPDIIERVRHLFARITVLVAVNGNKQPASSRIRGSYSSATDPLGARSYRGGPSERSAARTVFRETFMIRAICLIGSPSARYSRRISAQSSTLITSFLPGSARARIPGRRVKIRLPRWGQYSLSVDTGNSRVILALGLPRGRSHGIPHLKLDA